MSTSAPKRFVSWAAVSSLPQAKKISLEDQLSVNREHIEQHGGELVAELVVPGKSRSIVLFEDACERIEAYAQLRDLIKAKAFDVLIYLDRSRLGRKASLCMAVVELCHEAGIMVYETESPPSSLDASRSNYDDMMIGAFKSVGAQQEIERIKDRHRKGMLGRIQNGSLPSGVPPWGYRLRYTPEGEPVVEIEEESARWVLQIIEWYLAGNGTPTIAQWLNERGITTPTGKQWWPELVRSIVFRAWRYAGYGEINRRSVDRPYLRAKGNWPAIIDEATAEQVFAERYQRISNRRLSNTRYLLSGVCWCVHCNRRMHINTTFRRRPSRRLQMQIRCMYGDHKHREISYYRVLAALRGAIILLQNSDLSEYEEDNSILETLQSRITSCEAAIERFKAAQRRADDAFVAGIMDAERYARQVERLSAQIVAEQMEIQNLQAKFADESARGSRRERVQDLAAQGLAMLESEDITAANAWLRSRVRIWVEAHKVVEIEWL